MIKLALFLISFSAMASNWMPVSKIQAGNSSAYQLEDACETASGEQCLDVGSEPEAVTQGFVSTEDDWSGKSYIEECSGQEDCEAKLAAKTCEVGQKFIDQDYTHVYCTSVIGKQLVVNTAGFNAYKAGLAAAAQVQGLISLGAKAEADCKKVLHLIGGFNLQPGRTQSQIDTMSSAFESIKQALQDGRPGKAKGLIQAITPDGTIVTQQMKDLALQQLVDWTVQE